MHVTFTRMQVRHAWTECEPLPPALAARGRALVIFPALTNGAYHALPGLGPAVCTPWKRRLLTEQLAILEVMP